MDKQVVKLDKQEVRQAIANGDNAYGRRYLAVSPSGETRIHWADANRQWDPWGKNDQVIGLPALNPEGSGEESEDAEDMMKALGRHDEAAALVEAEDINWPEAVERLAADDWAYNRGEKLDWLADAFLSACNGDGSELNWPTPWGATYGEDGYGPEQEAEPPFAFEWE